MARGGKIVKYTEAERQLILSACYSDLPKIAEKLQRPLKGIIEAARKWVLLQGLPTSLVLPRKRKRNGARSITEQEITRTASPKYNSHASRPDWFNE
jgi:hypothetical protein